VRVTSKLAASSGLLILVLMVVPWLGLSQVRQLALLQRGQIEVELRATMLTLELESMIPQLDSLSRKTFVLRDSSYAERVQELTRELGATVEQLDALELSERVHNETAELNRLWQDFPFEAQVREALEQTLGPEDEKVLVGAFRDRMLAISQQLDAVSKATREAIEAKAAKTLEDSRRAETLYWLVVIIALGVAVPFLIYSAWSIREPLRRLEEGTRGVTRGIYSYELDTTSRDEFSDLALSFNEMVTRLGELDQMKRDFLSHVSHELKTPLVAMDETNRLMLDELPGPLNEQQRKFLELNLEGSRRLADMISKLLDLARMEERAVLFELQTNDLVELCGRVSDSFLARASELDVRVTVEAGERPVLAECDGDRIVQLVSNLVDNALKHSPAGSGVELHIQPADATGRARIEVADSGPGVPDDEKSKIFEKFHQVGRPMTGGVGLGLAICREIVDAHQGKIWVEDNPSGGSVFIVALQALAEGRRAQTG
jgi:two-component system sensor histidine kinase GlrK